MEDQHPKIEIGKDIIESLTLSMYEDCRFIYREYIQNAADAIVRAWKRNVQCGCEPERGGRAENEGVTRGLGEDGR